MTDPVPFLDLTAQFGALEAEWLAAIRETGAKGSFILGPNVADFEREFAEYVGVKHAIGVANGTDSLILSLRALGIGPGDEVITTPYTFFASSEAIDVVGATPVFADIDPASFTLDPKSVAERVTDRTRAIVPVHIFGHPCDMSALGEIARRHKLAVIEDCAQSFGATVGGRVVGSMGDAGSFSFYPTKVLGCYGDGGMITTNSDAVNEHVRRLRNHGAVKPFIHVEVGCNSRLDEIQAALLRIKLRRVRADIDGRRGVARAYDRRLAGTALVVPATAAGAEHAYNLYTVRIPRGRDAARQALADAGIPTALCYPQGLHLQEVYRRLDYRPGSLPVCERLTEENLSLPIYPGMPERHIDRVCEALTRALA
ncbi:pleiotropic regulatory protein [Sulfurifustis variabilis]|uniref:Pleiotropic regulatory protein n=1 Tax=Sulfurifustis variabilis TaxID=1675686 RepID=A0A1B4VE28_9GAMM|nr:DegT/DnrJ/EryC1/StrS family aminotransferase [Sulfurifustis variabilis]BAU48867.1 pleiotropic regulatory protein [Sulfurifustis variabilis]